MTTGQYLLNLGTKTLTRTRMVLPLVVVAVAAYAFLREMPTIGDDARLEPAGAAAGVALGVVAGLLVRGSPGAAYAGPSGARNVVTRP